jgi:hypothetical protein
MGGIARENAMATLAVGARVNGEAGSPKCPVQRRLESGTPVVQQAEHENGMREPVKPPLDLPHSAWTWLLGRMATFWPCIPQVYFEPA